MSSAEETPKFRYIDALRGWAILLVILVHAGRGLDTIHKLDSYDPSVSTDMALPYRLQFICDYGYNGVTLFFVVSALSLTLSALKRERFVLRDYAVRRFLRIAPMFYLGILFYLMFFGWGPRWFAPEGIGMADLAATFAFVHIWRENAINSVVPGGWSIGVEATFYVMLPIVLLLLQKSWKFALAANLLAFLLTEDWYLRTMLAGKWTGTSYFSFIDQLPVFFIGISCAMLIRRFPRPGFGRWWGFVLLPFMIAGVPLLPIRQNYVPSHLLFALLAGLLCYVLHFQSNRLVVNRVTEKIGLVSFSMYLVHFALLAPAHAFASMLTASRGAGFFAIYYGSLVLATFLCSCITYYLIEAPCIRFSHRVFKK